MGVGPYMNILMDHSRSQSLRYTIRSCVGEIKLNLSKMKKTKNLQKYFIVAFIKQNYDNNTIFKTSAVRNADFHKCTS